MFLHTNGMGDVRRAGDDTTSTQKLSTKVYISVSILLENAGNLRFLMSGNFLARKIRLEHYHTKKARC